MFRPDARRRSFDRWRRATDDAAHDTAVLGQATLSLLWRHAERVHDDGELHGTVGALEQLARFVAGHATYLGHDALAAVDQFVVVGAQVDHQDAESLAQPYIRVRGDHS